MAIYKISVAIYKISINKMEGCETSKQKQKVNRACSSFLSLPHEAKTRQSIKYALGKCFAESAKLALLKQTLHGVCFVT